MSAAEPTKTALPVVNLDQAAERLAALGQPTRLAIYRVLVRAGPAGCSVGDIQKRTGVPNSTLSFHLRKLADVGLVSQERRAATLICRSNDQAMFDTLGFLAKECCADAC